MCLFHESQMTEIIFIQIISSNSFDLLFPPMDGYLPGKLELTT